MAIVLDVCDSWHIIKQKKIEKKLNGFSTKKFKTLIFFKNSIDVNQYHLTPKKVLKFHQQP
jgi:hypothetical protein